MAACQLGESRPAKVGGRSGADRLSGQQIPHTINTNGPISRDRGHLVAAAETLAGVRGTESLQSLFTRTVGGEVVPWVENRTETCIVTVHPPREGWAPFGLLIRAREAVANVSQIRFGWLLRSMKQLKTFCGFSPNAFSVPALHQN
jgi:hypothetical protein